jgi:hypothetical protein
VLSLVVHWDPSLVVPYVPSPLHPVRPLLTYPFPFLLQLPNPFKRVEQGSVGLVSRFGQFYKSVDPGLTYVNVASETLRTVDVKIQLSNVPKQAVMTKDNG